MNRITMYLNRKLYFWAFILEIAVVYTAIGYAAETKLLSRDVFYLTLGLTSLFFSLYYGVRGAAAGAVGSLVIIYFLFRKNTFPFLSHHYIESSFFLAALGTFLSQKSLSLGSTSWYFSIWTTMPV